MHWKEVVHHEESLKDHVDKYIADKADPSKSKIYLFLVKCLLGIAHSTNG